MKLHILTHNIRGRNNPESILKERRLINSLVPKMGVIMVQEHKLRGRLPENLGSRLMIGCSSWILEEAPRKRSWLNPNATCKIRVGVIFSSKNAKLPTMHGSFYENRIVWVKLEGIEGEISNLHVYTHPTYGISWWTLYPRIAHGLLEETSTWRKS